jgi:AraC family transcriptional regulator
LASRLYEEFRRADELSPLVLEGLTLELLAACARQPVRMPEPRPPRWLATVLELLHAQFAERLTTAAIAESVGVHPAHLARVFRQCYGRTMGDYVRHLRIEYARRRLATSDAPLAEIALAAGFSDQSHFSNTFKRLLSESPAAFRKSVRPRKGDASEGSTRAIL